MKSDNLFTFVAVRPPETQETLVRLAGDETLATQVGEQIEAKREQHEMSLAQARLAVGSEIIQSDLYFTAVGPIRALADSTRQARALLRAAQRERRHDEFRTAALKLLKPINPANRKLDTLIASDEYKAVYRCLWLSYYATLLNPYERPQDREIITTWLLFSYLVEASGEDVFKSRAQQLPKVRPALPSAFFGPEETADQQEPPPPSDDLQRRAQDIAARIAALQDARRELTDLFMSKMAAFEQPGVEETPPVAKAQEGQPPRAAGTGGGADQRQAAPWRITAAERETHAEALRRLHEVGIPQVGVTLPDLIDRLDTTIAALNAEAQQLGTREELFQYGKSFVQIRRAQRFER